MQFFCIALLSILTLCGGALQAIGTVTRTFYDPSRERPLITTFWYPEPFAPGKLYPLVLFSHNSGGSRLELVWLAEFFAENGYIVASVDHYGETNYLKLPASVATPWDRPQDLSFLMLSLSTDPQFGPRFKQDKVVVVGYSTGALTALWLAGAKANKYPDPKGKLQYKDYRVKAIVLLAPGFGPYFDQYGLEIVKTPTLILAPQNDTVYPLRTNAMHFAKFIPNAKYVKIKGIAPHDLFLSPGHDEKARILKRISEFLKTSL